MEDRCSSRASGTTYHSFNDSELFVEPPRPPVTYDSKSLQQLGHLQLELQRQQREALNTNREQQQQQQQQQQQARRPITATKMQRQDSGYESNTPPRRASTSNSRPSVGRRSSNGSSKDSSVGGVRSRFRNRPSLRRAVQTAHPVQTARTSNQSLHLVRTNTATQPAAFFHFPSPDPVQLADTAPEVDTSPTPVPSPPPQTTHYWTSDRTRRLEYAAIDAATRGVKGWIMRHIVPDCFVSHDNRHVSFDDDSGSVRRYRLELEDDRDEKVAANKPVRRRKGWRFWRRRKVEAQPAAYI